jgi:hypothetical protein
LLSLARTSKVVIELNQNSDRNGTADFVQPQIRSTSSNLSQHSIMSGAKRPNLVKYRVCAARQKFSEKIALALIMSEYLIDFVEAPLCQFNRFDYCLGVPLLSNTTINLPTSAESNP